MTWRRPSWAPLPLSFQAKEKNVADSLDSLTATVRPDVPMQMYTCVQHVMALGCVRALRDAGLEAHIVWPAGVAVDGEEALHVRARAGYEEGLFAEVTLAATERGTSLLAQRRRLLSEALEASAREWEASLRRAGTVAGPLAPVLDEYFSLLLLAQKEVDVVYPNGNLCARGVLAGMDVWGRAAVRTASGRVVDISPEQASLRGATA